MYSHVDIDAAPLGRLVVGMEEDRVVFAHLARGTDDVERILATERKEFPDMRRSPADHPVCSLLRAYLDGERVDPADYPVHWTRGTEFQRRVWSTLRKVKRGRFVTYGELAEMAGNPLAARAVGGAVGRNPMVLFVPCHRVLAVDGLGGFSAGLDAKRNWLRKEGVAEVRLSGRSHEHSG